MCGGRNSPRLDSIGRHHIHIGLRLRGRNDGLQSPNNAPVEIVAKISQLTVTERHRNPQVRTCVLGQTPWRELESLRHYADDSVRLPIEGDGTTDNACVAAKAPFP